MAESPVPEAEGEFKRCTVEEQMDSSSLVTHPEINCDSGLKTDMSKVADFPDAKLDTEKVCVEMDADKSPVDCTKLGTEDEKSGNVDSTISTQVDVNCIGCVAEIGYTSLVDATQNSKSALEQIKVAHQESSDSEVSERSIPDNVELMIESCVSESRIFVETVDTVGERDDTQKAESESNIQVIPVEKDDGSLTLPMDVTDSGKKTIQENEDDPCDSKDVYRETAEISDSDSEDSDCSSVSSLSSPSKSGSGSDSDVECVAVPGKNKKGSYPVIKAKGELLPEDLPPIEELHISVPSSLCAEIGVVTSIVKTLVVIQSLKGVPALDLDSVLFLDSGSRSLGLVFDVFGPVTEPLYCVRFNSAEQIAGFNVNPGDKVYYAPQTEHSKYVFLQQLMRMKGSDASRQYDLERRVQVEYSDDEEERKAMERYGDEIQAEEEGLDLDQLKRKRDPNEVMQNKKKFAPQFPPRNPRGGFSRPQMSPRTRPPPQRQGQRQNYRPPRPHEGPIHPPSFNFPPPSIAGPSAMSRQNPPVPENTYPSYPVHQGMYNHHLYQNPMQQNSSFGQLPYAQPQMDPRIAQFGAQIAQMVCSLQSSPSNVAPPATPSFNVPYNQPLWAHPSPPATYSAPPFSAPPPLPPTNIPPPPSRGQPAFPPPSSTLSNQNGSFGGPYTSTYSSYPNHR